MSEFDPGTLATDFVESVPDVVFVLDREMDVLWCNERASAVTGYDADELDDMNAIELLPAEQREDASNAFDRTASFPPSYSLEFDLLTEDGRRIPYDFNGFVLEHEDQEVFAVIARDVTTRRMREREIRRQRDELETLNSISETVYGVVQAVVDAATRSEIETALCEALADSELYRSVWIGREGTDGDVIPSTGVGQTDEFVEAVTSLNDLEWDRPAKLAVRSGEVQVTQRMAESGLPEQVKETTAELGISAGIAVPVVHRGTVDGALCVYSSRPDAFSEREQAAFERLGEVVGFALNAVRNERLLLSDVVTQLTFRFVGPDAFLASVSREADGPCRIVWSTPVEGADGGCRHYVTVSGLEPESVRELAEDIERTDSVTYLGENDGEQLFSVVSAQSVTRRLLDIGATPTSIVARDGETTIVTELATDVDVRPVVETVNDRYDAELVSKRELERPVRTTEEFHDAVASSLTERQQAALRHAYYSGYFSWPRDATAEEVAERMDVSSPTFHYHVRHGQRALLEGFLEHVDESYGGSFDD